MRKYLKKLKIEDPDFPVKGISKCKSFKMKKKAGIPVVLEHDE